MVNANKQKGTAFESAVRDLAKSKGLHAIRPAQAASADMGDVHLAGMVSIQCKDVANQAYTAWLADVAEQKVHAQLPFGVVVHKTRRASIADARAVMPYGDFLELISRLDLALRFVAADPYMAASFQKVVDHHAATQ